MVGVAKAVREPSLDELLECGLHAARQAGERALRYYQKGVEVERKPDQTPVTIADREAEGVLRGLIEAKFPEHGILGEELGLVRGEAKYRWVVDPIDGTQSFIRGVPFWGVLVGLEHAGEPVVGVAHFPALGEMLWARKGGGAWWNGQRAEVSRVSRLEDATLLLTDTRAFREFEFEPAFERLRARTRFERTWGDCYGHALVATGRAEIMLDPVMHNWDCCGLVPMVEEAGGRFVDWKGQRTAHGGNAISTNGALFEEVMRYVRE
jgi:histidinol phosphatase-like enzyme (inositol monophosphatase family)